MMRYYSSPRWSQEITDCSMPMTFDQYSACSYRCLYCFAFNQKSIGNAKADYLAGRVNSVDIERVKRIFLDPSYSQFGPFVQQRRAVQWGGMADPFDEHEQELGVGLELIRFFRALRYPISFSTKGVWWTEDERYLEQFRGAGHFHVKVSVITLDEYKAKRVEVRVETPERRLQAIRNLAALGIGGISLRLRPFIIGISTPSYLELIRRAFDAGADALSTEFLCIEQRTPGIQRRWKHISRLAGVDLLEYYKEHSPGQSGYLRGSREMKRPFIDAMRNECEKLGMRFYVSDAHFKEYCANGSCCGLSPSWNYSRGQFTEALVIAKEQGRVSWADIEGDLDYAETFTFGMADGFNQSTSEARGRFHDFTMKDWMRYHWNSLRSGKGLYRYFGGVLCPVDRDNDGNIIYEYRGER